MAAKTPCLDSTIETPVNASVSINMNAPRYPPLNGLIIQIALASVRNRRLATFLNSGILKSVSVNVLLSVVRKGLFLTRKHAHVCDV